MNKVFAGLLCLILVFSLPSISQKNKEDWKKFYSQSFEYFYNGEYPEAIRCLESALLLNPSQPAIYWRLSCVLGFKAQRDYKQKRDIDKLKDRFDEITDRGIRICKGLLKSDPKNTETLFYLGAFYGNRGHLISSTTSKLGLLFKRGAVLNNLKTCCQKLSLIQWSEPFYNQALVYLGAYNVFVEKDEQLGFKQLRDAMSYGEYQDDAKFIYKGIVQGMIEEDKSKERISEIIGLTEELLKKYPRNLELDVDLVVLYWKKGELVEAKRMGDRIRQKILKHSEYPQAGYMVYLLYKLDHEIMPEIEKDLKKNLSTALTLDQG